MPLMELNLNPRRPHLRTFGLACFVVGGVAAVGLWKAAPLIAVPLAAIASLAAVVALLAPPLLRWPFIIATLIAWPIGFVVSWVLLAATYYGVFAPIGLIRRLFGDSLERKLDPSAATYWKQRPAPRDARSYFRQY